jgi:uncharacterized integral membrane protein
VIHHFGEALDMLTWLQETGEVYQGQFGEFTVTSKDRLDVVIYRAGLTTAAISFALGAGLAIAEIPQAGIVTAISLLFAIFCIALGVSLWTIHIYLKPLHLALQLFWGMGCIAAVAIAITATQPLPLAVYPPYSVTLIGVGFVFVALTGLFVKEAFCFNRLQAKLLVLMIPSLLLGHWLGLTSIFTEKILLGGCAIIFLWFAIDKVFQQIPPDLGDKTVFDYLKKMKQAEAHP